MEGREVNLKLPLGTPKWVKCRALVCNHSTLEAEAGVTRLASATY